MHPVDENAIKTLAVVIAIVGSTSSGCTLLFATRPKVEPVEDPADVRAARTSADILSTLARVHREQTGFLPETVDDLCELGRFEKQPKDPWGRPFLYWIVGNDPVFVSLGAAGKCGDVIASDGYEPRDGECEWRTTTCHSPTTRAAPRGWWVHRR